VTHRPEQTPGIPQLHVGRQPRTPYPTAPTTSSRPQREMS
jgi:hypothetical protein